MLVVVITSFLLIRKALCFKLLTSDAEGKEEANKRDAAEHSKSQRFAFGLDLGCKREEGASQEGANSTTSRRKCLCEAVDRSENGVVRS